MIREGEQASADVVILATSEAEGRCFVETANLDGETNLKIRKCVPKIHTLLPDDAAASQLTARAHIEAPNSRIHSFVGSLCDVRSGDASLGQDISVDVKNVLLRGCTVRNAKWIYGLVVCVFL